MHRIPFSVVSKPSGAECNIACTYCFYLEKEKLYPSSDRRMSTETLRTYLASYLEAQPDGEVVVTWQGGEPTLLGIDFYREAVQLAEELRRPRQAVSHSFQTNGILIDARWASFFSEHGFLVGLSIDGPAQVHDEFRVNRAGRGTHAQVVKAWRVLRGHGVETNLLCTVHAANEAHGVRVYQHFRDDLGAEHVQFIPIVEETPDGPSVRSVSPAGYGAFLCEVFDEWLTHDVGTVFVQQFETALAALFGMHTLCVHAPTCGGALALEHTGDVYSCDHFVSPEHLLGNLRRGDDFQTLLRDPKQIAFGNAKHDRLTDQCKSCDVRWACHGGCPKDRIVTSAEGQPHHNYLCRGYHQFFSHAEPHLRRMADLVRRGVPAAAIRVRP